MGARRRSRLRFNGVGHRGPSCGVFTGSPAEGMQIRPEQKVVPLAEGDAQSPQRTLDPRPLTDTPLSAARRPRRLRSVHW